MRRPEYEFQPRTPQPWYHRLSRLESGRDEQGVMSALLTAHHNIRLSDRYVGRKDRGEKTRIARRVWGEKTRIVGLARGALTWDVPPHYTEGERYRTTRNAVGHGGMLPHKAERVRADFDKWKLFLLRRLFIRLGFDGEVASPEKGWACSSPVDEFSGRIGHALRETGGGHALRGRTRIARNSEEPVNRHKLI